MELNTITSTVKKMPSEAETRRWRIEALAEIIDGLFPNAYGLGYEDLGADNIYDQALDQAQKDLVRELAYSGGLTGAVLHDECGEPGEKVADGCFSLGCATCDQWLRDLCHDLDCAWPGLPGTKAYGPEAIAELARAWLARQEAN